MPNGRNYTAGIYSYFKLAVFDPRLFTFRDGKETFRTGAEAEAAANVNGTYRVSGVRPDGGGRWDFEPFEVTDRAEPANQANPSQRTPPRNPPPNPRTPAALNNLRPLNGPGTCI
jgi:hypothetical protein